MVYIGISFVMPPIINMFIPNGGVTSAISIFMVKRMPNNIGSYPKLMMTGKMIGRVISVSAMVSMMHPRKIYTTMMTIRTITGGKLISVMKPTILAGSPLMVMKLAKIMAPMTIPKIMAVVAVVSFKDEMKLLRVNFA